MDAIELSSKLIKFKSITPQSSGSLEYIQEILKKSNFQCHLLEFGKDKIKNLYASFKGGEGPILCFAGHTDVVPPGDIKKWNSNPFEATSRNGKLYGRGASDMKTAIASFIVATENFLKKNNSVFDGTISFLLTSDEEGEAEYGTKSLIKWLKAKKKKVDFCLVGEPTNPNKLGEMIKIGRRGSINFSVEVSGEQGHVAYPEKAENPIDYIIQISKKLSKPFDKGSKNFQPTKLIITSIDTSNEVSNLIPSKAYIKFNVRFNENFKSSDIIKIVNERIKSVTSKFKLSSKVSGESFINYSHTLTQSLVRSIKTVTKLKPSLSTSGGTSDARFISEICPVLEFGSVGKTMHKVNEQVDLKNINILTEIYYQFIDNIFFNNINN